jgi:hypothetical protein
VRRQPESAESVGLLIGQANTASDAGTPRAPTSKALADCGGAASALRPVALDHTARSRADRQLSNLACQFAQKSRPPAPRDTNTAWVFTGPTNGPRSSRPASRLQRGSINASQTKSAPLPHFLGNRVWRSPKAFHSMKMSVNPGAPALQMPEMTPPGAAKPPDFAAFVRTLRTHKGQSVPLPVARVVDLSGVRTLPHGRSGAVAPENGFADGPGEREPTWALAMALARALKRESALTP